MDATEEKNSHHLYLLLLFHFRVSENFVKFVFHNDYTHFIFLFVLCNYFFLSQ